MELMFSWVDHTIFGLTLVVSLLVGVYYGIIERKHNTAKEDYLHGGKKMGVLPIAVSQVASHTSGIAIMAVPAEIYAFGGLYGLTAISTILVSIAINYIYLPVFFELQITSAYEYLERRYSKSVRLLTSAVYAISVLMYMPQVVYLPALAFSQVSGINIHFITPLSCGVCIFYTMLGGLKAVVWTDVLQSAMTLVAIFTVQGIGLYQVGGPAEVWRIAEEGGRLNFNVFTLNPFVRCSFWIIMFGVSTTWLAGRAINQDMVQRFIALPDLKRARRSLIGFTFGILLTNLMGLCTGLLMYSMYHDCDPVKAKVVSRHDQLLPVYVMKVAQGIPGLPGLFVAGIYSAALSTMSSCMNALSGTVYEDFIQPWMPPKVSETKVNLIMQGIALMTGLISVALVFVVERLGSIIEVGFSFGSVTLCGLLGIFTLGMVFPWANTKGAFAGAIVGMSTVATLMIGSQHAVATGRMHYTPLPTSIDGCDVANFTSLTNTTTTTTAGPLTEDLADDVPQIFRLSFMYYTLLGTVLMMVVGAAVSLATGPTRPEDLDPRLLAPQVRWIARRSAKRRQPRAEDKPEDPAAAVELLDKNTTS